MIAPNRLPTLLSRLLRHVLWPLMWAGVLGAVAVALVARRLQTGFLYHYAFLMVLGMFLLITWFVWLKP